MHEPHALLRACGWAHPLGLSGPFYVPPECPELKEKETPR